MVRQKDLEGKLNNSTDFLGVLSLGGVVLSGILLFTPIKAVGYIGVGSSFGAFAASVITRNKHLQIAKQHIDGLIEQHRSELTGKENEIVSLVGEVNTL